MTLPQPGDTIEWPSALDREPRGIEEAGRENTDVEPQPLTIEGHPQPEYQRPPCAFCNSPALVENRGMVRATCVLLTDDYTTVAHACYSCLEE